MIHASDLPDRRESERGRGRADRRRPLSASKTVAARYREREQAILRARRR
jgi:hypothetical protein